MKTPRFLALFAAVFLLGCPSEDVTEPVPEPEAGPYDELVEQGATRYLGAEFGRTATPLDDGVVTWTFDQGPGAPTCLRDTPYRVSVRDVGSPNTVVFLQGGGACWDDFCFAIENAPEGIPSLDVLDPELSFNPYRDWNVVYLPYCDGSLFAGDAAIDDDEDGQPDRFHRGLQNLSAAFDLAHETFPDPERVALIGASGGAFGTIPGAVLARELWPQVPLDVVNDSGVGVAKEGDPFFITDLLLEWNAASFIPPSCEGCTNQGHLVPLVNWQLNRDPLMRSAVFSSYDDYIISTLFLGLGPGVFKEALLRETGAVAAAHPDRYVRFLVEGEIHTAIIGNVSGVIGDVGGDNPFSDFVELGKMDEITLEGTTVADWLQGMVDDDPAVWRSLTE
ncbi:MAG: vtpJ-therm [Deltaproteobacteria bacterium]|nr:vtpJ-therm [Deltaproteobacteria bacterium]